MSRRWLLFLLCLFVPLLLFVQLTRARGALTVNESQIRLHFHTDSADLLLPVENSLREKISATLGLELLDPAGHTKAKAELSLNIDRGNQALSLALPIDLSKLSQKEQSQLLWFRLHYHLLNLTTNAVVADGIVSLSEITPDFFDVRVAAPELAHEGMRYRLRAQAIHPVTQRPASGVRIDGVLTLETDDEGNGVKLQSSGVTDSAGYAFLNFDLPPRFPVFPHETRPAGGSIKITAQRGGLIVHLENDVLVDQFARILISTDKPLYQPGQTLHIRALALSPTRHALANQEVIFRINDPEETLIFRETAKSSRFGIASVDWSIPNNIRLGDYNLQVALGEGEDSSKTYTTVRISRYDLPNFTVKVRPDRSYYLPGQNAELKVTADYLFGQPVAHGHVRVVRETEREWNYKEQKWDIEEGEKYEGETDQNGVFVAHADLSKESSDLDDDDYRRFKDVTYAAYFTDPTTNRTEQRRFDLRVTKEPIHVYIISSDGYRHSARLPLRFYVSTFYADGTPAQCRVKVNWKKKDNTSNSSGQLLMTVKTNRYGLAKVSGLRQPNQEDDSDLELKLSATDSRGNHGTRTEEYAIDSDLHEVRVETDKSLYQAGEPITIVITSSVSDLSAVVEVGKDGVVLNSQKVRLHGGSATLTIPFKPELQNRLTVVAYKDFADSRELIGSRAILYPKNEELKVDARPVAASYRPGAEAQVNLRVRAPEGSGVASALGMVVIDKAVEERSRTDQEFGRRTYGFYGARPDIFGPDQQIAGVSFRDLQRLDLSRPLPNGLDLVAEVLLNQNSSYVPTFFGGQDYEKDPSKVFGDLMRLQLAQVRGALATRYDKTREYPNNESSLRRMLAESGIDFDSLRDPWGNHYRPVFFVDKQSDVLAFESAGADKRFDTDDDLSIDSNRWAYFRPIGETIDRAVRQYHERARGFIRDYATLRSEVIKAGIDLDGLRDRWGQPYKFAFDVAETHYEIRIQSGGPDKKFSTDNSYLTDDFTIWTSTIDYFAESRAKIETQLTQYLKKKNQYPQSEAALAEALRNSDHDLSTLRDPWGHLYYALFATQSMYADRVRIENRARFGEQATERTEVTPVTRNIGMIRLRSAGADGKPGTSDDFDVATFANVISEQVSNQSKPVVWKSSIVLSGGTGAISGIVTDANKAVVPGASVTATLNSQVFTTTTDSEGRYVLINLLPGTYELRVQSPGFMVSVVTNVVVETSNLTTVNFELKPGATTETVTVTAGATETQTQSSNFSATQVQELPLNGRQLSSLTQLKGGVLNLVTKPGQASTPRLREYFPETLLWQPSLETDGKGRAQISFKLADNITTWKIAVIGSTEDGQIGVAEKEIKAFQPFFVEHDPPRVLTEGDEISLPVVVRNYLERAQNVDLEIKPESWFTLLGPASKQAEVAAGDATRETFDLRAIASVKDGKQRITARASDDSDAIEKPVTVHPDGEEQTATASDIVGDTATLELHIPSSVIAGSTQAELKIYPNLMGHVIESVEAIMSRPYGCGEQTISSTYPSLLLLKHYKETSGTEPGAVATGSTVSSQAKVKSQTGVDEPTAGGMPALQARAQRYLQDGYNRLLNYRDESGGFTYWGHGGPDIALTAYALRFLNDAREIIAVDDDVVKEASEWLIKQQTADGSWPAHYYWTNIEDKRRTALLTAYVARVLAITPKTSGAPKTKQSESQQKSPDLTASLKRALDYLGQRAEEIDEPYMLASYALAALDAGNAARASPVIAKLRALAHTEGNTSYWSLETNTPFYGWGLAGRVETTALVVQALARDCRSPNADCRLESEQSPFNPNSEFRIPQLVRSGLLFLLKEKDRYGVWYSTQATINVLDAMLTLLRTNAPNSASSAQATAIAEILVNGHAAQTVSMPPANQFGNPITVNLSAFVTAGNNRIEIRRAHNASTASAQAVATFYVPWSASSATKESNARPGESDGLRLMARFDRTEGKVSDEISCHVEAERVGFHGYGMMLAEIGLPPGADVDRASLETAMKASDWSISQYDVLPDRVVVYLWPRAGGVRFDFQFRPRFGLKAKTPPSTIYDYYNPEARAIVLPATFTIK
jgi:A-macroglobulin TED domain/Alpha-2-macroglobulin family/Carboxypeptidase regulatory-like domain/MG2 domain/A-macroglobulin receptor binding domain/Macroglobulin domain MG3/Alpha-2-macroglobulin bait region domain